MPSVNIFWDCRVLWRQSHHSFPLNNFFGILTCFFFSSTSQFKTHKRWLKSLSKHWKLLDREVSLTKAGVALEPVSSSPWFVLFFVSWAYVLILFWRLQKFLAVEEPKDFVYLLDNCPHDWLFLQCKAVVSHCFKLLGDLSFSMSSDLYKKSNYSDYKFTLNTLWVNLCYLRLELRFYALFFHLLLP